MMEERFSVSKTSIQHPDSEIHENLFQQEPQTNVVFSYNI